MRMTVPFTYSNYSTLRSCGRKFRYQVIDKLPQPPTIAFEFGTALHAGLNALLTGSSVEDAQDLFEAYWEGALKLNFTGQRMGPAEHRDVGNRFLANFQKRYGSKMEFVTGEQRLKMTLDGVEIEGTPDAVVKFDGNITLLDFKTSAYNYEPLRSEISLQLNLYSLLLAEAGTEVQKLSYVVFNKMTGSIQTPLVIDFDKEKALAMVKEALVYWKRNVGFAERNPGACVMGKSVCPFAERCWRGV